MIFASGAIMRIKTPLKVCFRDTDVGTCRWIFRPFLYFRTWYIVLICLTVIFEALHISYWTCVNRLFAYLPEHSISTPDFVDVLVVVYLVLCVLLLFLTRFYFWPCIIYFEWHMIFKCPFFFFFLICYAQYKNPTTDFPCYFLTLCTFTCFL